MSTMILDLPAGKGRYLTGEAAEALRARAVFLKKLALRPEEAAVLAMIGAGCLGLRGFMGREEYDRVVEGAAPELPRMPIVLRLTDERVCNVQIADDVTLVTPDGRDVGVLRVTDKWIPFKPKEARRIFGTDDAAHAGVQALLAAGHVYLGGEVELFDAVAP